MAALVANRERFVRNVGPQRKGKGVGADSKEFYEGALLCYDTAGKITPAADTAGFRIAGVAAKRQTTGASNTDVVEFEFGHEEWFPSTGIAAGDMQANAVITDDNTLTDALTATNDVEAGLVTELETKRGTAGAWIRVAEFGVDAA